MNEMCRYETDADRLGRVNSNPGLSSGMANRMWSLLKAYLQLNNFLVAPHSGITDSTGVLPKAVLGFKLSQLA